MITLIVNRDSERMLWEVNCVEETPPGTCKGLLNFAELLMKQGDATLVCSDALAELVIMRLLRRVREKLIKPSDLNLWVVHGGWKKSMEVTEDGDFISAFPGGFFEESLDELF